MDIPPPKCLAKPLEFPEKILMGPGPSNAPPRILQAAAKPLLGHMHPEFTQILDEIKEGIQYAFQTRNKVTFAVSATGHGAMETAVVNLVEAGDTVLVLTNGIWGDRFADMVTRHGGLANQIFKPPGEVFTLAEVEMALRKHNPSLVFVTQGESSTGTLHPIECLGSLCHRYKSLLVVDSVASMGGVPLFMDKWEIDVLYSGSQKVLSAPPGASPISFSDAAWKKIQSRKTPVQSFYFDAKWLANYWGCDGQPRKYHHTGPMTNMYTLREGLALLAHEGLERTWLRHKNCANILHRGLADLGLSFLVANPENRLPTVTAVLVPTAVDWKQVSDFAMSRFKVEISGGLGPTASKIWRVGIMGYNAMQENVLLYLRALREGIEHSRKSTCSKL